MSLTKSKLRDLIKGATRIVEGQIFQVLPADDDFRYDVKIVYSLDEQSGRLTIRGFSNLEVSGADKVTEALLFCNKYNKERAICPVHFDLKDQDFNIDFTMFTEGASDNYIEKEITRIAGVMWHFFVAAGKEF